MKKTAGKRTPPGMPRLLALLAVVVMSGPAIAQSRGAGEPAIASVGADWSEFGLVGGESGARAVCASGICSATDTRAGHLRTTILDGLAVRPNLLQERQPAGRIARDARPGTAQEWRQHVGVRDGEEDYNCFLSLGIGGELKADGYVGARLFGRTMTWNRPGGKGER
jgi:hypothetical protein